MTDQMPRIDLETIKSQLTPAQFELVTGIVSSQGKNKGCLRAAKPKVAKMVKIPAKNPRWNGDYTYDFANAEDAKTGDTAYIWRMVAFSISPKSQHHCMPCTADFAVTGFWGEEKRAHLAALDAIVDVVVKSVPVSEWHGIRRWGQAFGQIGTPQVSADGSIIYR